MNKLENILFTTSDQHQRILNSILSTLNLGNYSRYQCNKPVLYQTMTYCPKKFCIIWMCKLMEVNIFHVQSKVAVVKFMHVVVKGINQMDDLPHAIYYICFPLTVLLLFCLCFCSPSFSVSLLLSQSFKAKIKDKANDSERSSFRPFSSIL